MKIAIIGSGFAGLTAASYLAKAGFDVHLFEKHDQPGGRARSFEDQGFTFDMGPSWYWMPEVFEKFFNDFKSTASDHYLLKRLDPSYKVVFSGSTQDVPAGKEAFLKMAEHLEAGSSVKVHQFLEEAEMKYETAMNGFVQKPSLSFMEFSNPKYLFKALKLNMFKSFSDYLNKVTNEPRLRAILEFPVLFLGETPKRIPALYSIMNHADISLGTWYPMGGMKKVAEGFYKIAQKQGVKFHFNAAISTINTIDDRITSIEVNGENKAFDIVIGGADYAHVETLLPKYNRQYDSDYWNSRAFAPSCLIYYVGIKGKVPGLLHHNLFFDTDFEQHSNEIYKSHEWPKDPLFYVCCPSKTDSEIAPDGDENLFVLIPVSTKIEDTEVIRERYFKVVLDRLEKHLGFSLKENIVVKHSYARSNFIEDYNAFAGNAYGLANTLTQTAFLKPKMKSTKVSNLYFTGQLTVPGPGVPPAIISGETVAKLIQKEYKK